MQQDCAPTTDRRNDVCIEWIVSTLNSLSHRTNGATRHNDGATATHVDAIMNEPRSFDANNTQHSRDTAMTQLHAVLSENDGDHQYELRWRERMAYNA